MATPAEAEALRQTPEYQAAMEQLDNREWRLSHLYYIKDKDGIEVLFEPNAAQRALIGELWYRDVIAKARQLGFSTLIEMLILDDCIFRDNTIAAIIDYKLDDAVKKLAKIRFAYDRLPIGIRNAVRATKSNEHEMHFSNGSQISVGTSYRGDNPQILHVSEYGKISTDAPETAREIKTGAFNAVAKSGKIYVESTAHGVGGEFYDLVERSSKLLLSGSELTGLDFRMHFFGWWIDPSYRLQANLVVITQELQQYFEEVAPILRDRYGVKLDAEQKAWYAKMHEAQGPDDMKSEYPTIVEECFFNSLAGSYFKRELSRARLEKRIGFEVPYDPTRPVNTFGDIGMDDEQAIWFHQTDGVRHRFIDFASSSGEGLSHYIRCLKDKQEKRGFIYGKHYGPHDLAVKEWANPNVESRAKVAEGFGIKFIVVPRVQEKGDAIEAARRLINTSYFDVTHCADGVRALDNYRKKWNEKLSSWSAEPVHDWASHPSDALMCGAMGLTPDKPQGPRRGGSEKSGTSWSS